MSNPTAPPARPARLLSLILLTLLAFVGLGASPAMATEDNPVGACLSSDGVWLLVVDGEGTALANECVDAPTSGEDALVKAGLTLGYADGFICSIDGTPEVCPATFDGSYWAYFHGAPGEAYAYSEVGAGAFTPAGGTIEAWCFATAEAKECTPPQLNILMGGTPVAAPDGLTAVDLPFTGETASPSASPSASATESANAEPTDDGATDQGSGTVVWAVVGGLVVVAAAVGVVVWLRRRGSGAPKATGGR